MKKIYALFSILIIFSLLLIACGGAQANLAQSNVNRDKSPSVNESDLQTLVDGNNTFALDIYKSLRSENGNLILSPFSISLALAMTYAGARGETESQMAQALHFLPQEQLHPAFNQLDLNLESEGINLDEDQEPLQLNIANSVWAEQTFSFLPEFLDTIAGNYGAGIYLSDFINNAEPTRKEINNWVSDETEEKIKDLLPQDSVGPDTRMVLVNAIYFKADWFDQFDADDTYDVPFSLLDGTQVNVPMMGQEMYIPYISGDGYQAIELPYAGNTAVMNIILPDEGRFDEIESNLNYEMLSRIFGSMSQTSMFLRMPKFEFESSFSVADALKELGMVNAFNSSTADFSGMTGDKDLFIGDVIHKAFVAVDEEGTEAAAATAVILEAASAQMNEFVLVIDRPFIFLIRDLESGQILFAGRVLNPQ
jgi:serpin B